MEKHLELWKLGLHPKITISVYIWLPVYMLFSYDKQTFIDMYLHYKYLR